MRFWLTNFNRLESVDGWLAYTSSRNADIVGYDQLETCAGVLLGFTWQHAFEFDRVAFDRVASLGLPIIVLDFHEHMGTRRTSILGARFTEHLDERYAPLHDALEAYPPALYFKRELPVELDGELVTSFAIHPVDFTHEFPAVDPVSEADYHARPIDVLMVYGYSNRSRPMLHGKLLQAMSRFAWTPVETAEDVDFQTQVLKVDRQLLIRMVPHYRRIAIQDINALQARSKLVISCWGAGVKCFRSAECSYQSVGVHQYPEIVRWAYPWLDGQNCLTLPNLPLAEVIDMEAALERLWVWLRLRQGDLFPVYVAGQQTHAHYYAPRYWSDYLLPKMKEVCRV